MASSKNLLVIGPGQLGARVATLWKERFPEAKIALKANKEDQKREAKWQSLGFVPYVEDAGEKYPYVLFAAPPSGSNDGEAYANEVAKGIANLATTTGDSNDARYVFTSSGGVYVENSGGLVDESSPVSSSVSRYAGILAAEKAVLENTCGIALRFGGLYTLARGVHHYWGGVETSPGCPNGLINLVHYDDAAEAVIAAFQQPLKEKLFLVSDGQPVSRMQICEAVKKNVAQAKCPTFTGDANVIDGKRYNVAKVQTMLGWRPKFANFSAFMESGYVNEMSVPLLQQE